MTKVIYKDESRTISMSDGILMIQGRKNINLGLTGLIIRDLATAEAGRLKEVGLNPADHYALSHGGQSEAILPNITKVAISQAIQEHSDKATAPVVIARDKVNAMFAKAEAMIDHPEQYYALRAQAMKAYKEWAAAYPAEARKEDADEIIAQAEQLERMAADALAYDCDGDLDETARKARADKYAAKASDLRAKAKALASS